MYILYMYLYNIYAIFINEKEPMNFRKNRKRYMRWKKGKGEIL